MADALWGLCRRRHVRDARSANEGAGSDCPVAAGGSVCGWLEAAGRVTRSAIRPAAAPERIVAVVADAALPTGVHGAGTRMVTPSERGCVTSCRPGGEIARARGAA